MSTGPRIPLQSARAIASSLMQALNLREPEAMVVGSIRRQREDVGDIDIIAPLPGSFADDRLYRAIANAFQPAKAPEQPALFTTGGKPATSFTPLGRVLQGHNPLFLECELEVWVRPEQDRALKAIAGGRPLIPVKASIARYRATPGNRGWLEIMRTGNAEFSKAVLECWKWQCGTRGTAAGGLKDNHLVDQLGNARATPTEFHVFQLIGCVWVPPALRTGPQALCRAVEPFDPAKRRVAMRHLGITDETELADRFRQDRYAASASQH